MAIIRTNGGKEGVADYLKFGKKQGRGYTRSQLDDRIPLHGDLDVIDKIILSMDRGDAERYLHVTNSFKEDYIPVETIAAMNGELRGFLLSAYGDDEVAVYSEIHKPKIKSYVDNGGENIDRRVHEHTIIPTINLLTGERANPLEKVDAYYGAKWSTNDYIRAFQEDQNDRYGLASPEQNQRMKSGKADMLDRAKTDKSALTPEQDFRLRGKTMRIELMQEMIAQNVTTYAEFKKLVEGYGKVENGFAGKDKTPYLKVRQGDDKKAMRLDDVMFSREFIALPTAEKIKRLDAQNKHEYIETRDPIVQATEELAAARQLRAEMIKYWHEIRAREIRYLSPSSKFFKDCYKYLSDAEKIQCLDTLERGETYKSGEFSLAPTSSRFNSYGAERTEEDLSEGRALAAGDGQAIVAMIDTLTENQSSISRDDISTYLLDRIDIADESDYNSALKNVLNHGEIVVLDVGLKTERYTSRKIHKIEQSLIAVTNKLKGERGDKIDIGKVDISTMNEGQKAALDAVLSGSQLSIVNGAAGTGKSFMLNKSRQAFEAAGYVLHGVCLQGKTAEDLEAGSKIKSGTLHSFLSKYDSGKIRINERSVIVLDEAGMIGSEQWDRLVSICELTGARLVAVGDTYQVQAVSYGSAFAQVSKIVGVSGLTEIMRQKTRWQNDASVSFSTHNIEAGLTAYDKNGRVHFERDQLDAIDALARRVREDRRTGLVDTSLVICKSNEERLELNRVIREGLIADGIIKSDGSFVIKKDGRKVDLAEGDRVMFTAANRNLKVKNGTTGTVIGIDETHIYIDIDGRSVSINRESQIEIEQGYAVTINKSQGMTVNKAYVLASDIMSANDLYVAATRHKDDLEIFTSREHFETIDHMIDALSDASHKSYTGESDEVQIDVNSLDRLVREQNVDALIARDAARANVRTLNREIDLHDLLHRLAESHGLDPEKYGINREQNRIVCGSRELSATEFLTDEMSLKMDWKDVALPLLREAYAGQIKGVYCTPQEPATRAEMKDFKLYVRTREQAHEKATSKLKQDARVIKKQIRDNANILPDDRDVQIDQIQAKLETDLGNLDRAYAVPNRQLFDEFRSTEIQTLKRAAIEEDRALRHRKEEAKAEAPRSDRKANLPMESGKPRDRAAEAMVRLQENNKPQFSQSDLDNARSALVEQNAARQAVIDAEVSRRAAEAGKGGSDKPDEAAIRAQVEAEIRRTEEEAECRRQAALSAQYGSQYEM